VTKNSLSRVLKSFGVKSKQLRIGKTNRYGYEAEQFADAWARYTGLSPSNSAARNATALQPMCDADSGGSEDARRDSSVAFLDTRKPSSDAGCSGAAFSPGVSSGGACSRCGGEGCGDCREVEPWRSRGRLRGTPAWAWTATGSANQGSGISCNEPMSPCDGWRSSATSQSLRGIRRPDR